MCLCVDCRPDFELSVIIPNAVMLIVKAPTAYAAVICFHFNFHDFKRGHFVILSRTVVSFKMACFHRKHINEGEFEQNLFKQCCSQFVEHLSQT